jgi:hypothetical protein
MLFRLSSVLPETGGYTWIIIIMATTVELTDNAFPVHDAAKVFSDEQVENVKHIPTVGAESFQPEQGVEYNVTFKTWVVIFVRHSSMASRPTK